MKNINFKQTETRPKNGGQVGEIPEGWDIRAIADLPIDIIDGDRGINYPKKNEFEKQGFCLFLNTKNVPGEHFDFSECDFISEKRDQILRKGKLQKGDIVLTTRGTVGNVAYYHERIPYEHIRINSGMVIIRNAGEKFDTSYLYHLLKSPLVKQQYLSFATGSAQPQLPIRDINKIKLTIPPLPEQRAIAKILSDLDEKIELNQQMNKTLESIAQAIFKRWFVDFEFPGNEKVRFVDDLPKGWHHGALGEIITVESGKRPGEKSETKTRDFVVPLIGASSVMGFVKDALYNEPILIIGRVGTHGVVQRVSWPSFPSDNTLVIRSKHFEFVYQILKTIDYESLNVGTTQPLITQTAINKYGVVIPSNETLEQFEAYISGLFKKVVANNRETGSLIDIRDSLLPRLMSGKIRISYEN